VIKAANLVAPPLISNKNMSKSITSAKIYLSKDFLESVVGTHLLQSLTKMFMIYEFRLILKISLIERIVYNQVVG
jgi:hypothetical protein